MIKRLRLCWAMFRRVLGIEHIDKSIPKLESLREFIPKLEALQDVMRRMEEMEGRMPSKEAIEGISSKLGALDSALAKIEAFKPPEPVVVQVAPGGPGAKKINHPDMSGIHGWNRLRMLAKFVSLSEKAAEIEKEWQQIQQAEHDAYFAFQTYHGQTENEYHYRKGIAEGIRWCLTRFS